MKNTNIWSQLLHIYISKLFCISCWALTHMFSCWLLHELHSCNTATQILTFDNERYHQQPTLSVSAACNVVKLLHSRQAELQMRSGCLQFLQIHVKRWKTQHSSAVFKYINSDSFFYRLYTVGYTENTFWGKIHLFGTTAAGENNHFHCICVSFDIFPAYTAAIKDK